MIPVHYTEHSACTERSESQSLQRDNELNNKTTKAHCLLAALKLKSKAWHCYNTCEQGGIFKTKNLNCLLQIYSPLANCAFH